MSNRYKVTMLVPGVYTGIAGGTAVYTAEAIKAGAASMRGGQFMWWHTGDVDKRGRMGGEPVGRVVDAHATDDGKLVGMLELDPNAPKFHVVKGFLDSALELGAVPNVSIEGTFVPEIKNGLRHTKKLTFTGLALVPRGACSDRDGCGITAALSEVTTMTDNTTATTTGTTVSGPVEFTILHKLGEAPAAEKKPCECEKPATKLAEIEAKDAEIAQLAAKLKAAEDELATMKLEQERAPLVAELAQLAPDYSVEGKSLDMLKAAVEVAKLAASKAPAPADAGRKTMLAPAAEKPAHSPEYQELSKLMGLA